MNFIFQVEEIVEEEEVGPITNNKRPDFHASTNTELVNHTMGNAWTLTTDQNTGKLVYFNRVSKQKRSEKPFGVKLSPEDQALWDKA